MNEKMQLHSGTEYLQPPPGPPTLDATKSPLALLAQTCSSIGKETNPISHNRSIRVDPHNIYRKTSPPVSMQTNVKPSTFSNKKEENGNGENQNKSSTKVCSSPKSKSSPLNLLEGAFPREQEGVLVSKNFESHIKLIEQKSKKQKNLSPLSNSFGDKKKYKVDSRLVDTTSSSKQSSTFSCASQERKFSTPWSGSRNCTKASSFNKHLSLCEPYCTGCRASHTSDAIKPCQLYFPLNLSSPTYPLYAQMLAAAACRSSAVKADSAPHVCHWVISGTETCGKRFSTAEELLRHLQTHALTSSSNSTNPLSFFMNSLDRISAPYAAYLSQPAAALAATAPPSTDGRNILAQTYNPLNRFHPYKSNALISMPNISTLPIPAGVSPYNSLLPFYGSRFGPATAPFTFP